MKNGFKIIVLLITFCILFMQVESLFLRKSEMKEDSNSNLNSNEKNEKGKGKVKSNSNFIKSKTKTTIKTESQLALEAKLAKEKSEYELKRADVLAELII